MNKRLLGKRVRALLAASVLALAACSQPAKPQFKGTDITGAELTGNFTLTGHDGKPHGLADWQGKVVVVFFGFTQCPDVCPTTLAEMATAMKKLGERANDVQVLFISVDPERDTPELLAKYVPAFDPRFMGLVGTSEQTAQAARAFKVFYQKAPGTTPGSYTVDHTAGLYVLDRDGRLRLFMRNGQDTEALVHDLNVLLDAKRT